ncbi:hypothetical protein Q7P37_003729 [Cladosporium fusiforme]
MNTPTLSYLFFLVGLAHAYSCIDFNAPITVTAPSYKPAFSEFGNHYDAVLLLQKITTRPTGKETPLFSGSENVTFTISIDASFCTASDQPNENQDIQVLTHGIGFDKSYWDFGGRNSEYNYVRAATNAGYATLSWSRPGQLYAALPKPTGRVLHVGHSFGSVLSNVLISEAPELSNGAVLTGLSHNATWGSSFPISSNFHLAKEVRPEWANLSTGMLTWADELANQYVFFRHPNFDPKVLRQAERIKQPFAIGEFLTLFLPSLAAPKFTGPVLLTSGEYDMVLCGGDCTGILEPAAVDFPASTKFETYLQPNTGHGMNLHYNASGFYDVVIGFLKA